MKSKGYEKQYHALEHVAIEISCHTDGQVNAMAKDVETKVECMGQMMKTYKKLIFKAEAELKKDFNNIKSWKSGILDSRRVAGIQMHCLPHESQLRDHWISLWGPSHKAR